jgi:hypothetical protein
MGSPGEAWRVRRRLFVRRTPQLALASTLAALVWASPALAQQPDAELRSIDAESAWATGLYVAAPVLFATGALIGALVMSSGLGGGFGILPGGGYGARSSGDGLASVALALVALAPIALGIAIGLDVDSGARRGRWQRARGVIATAAVTPEGFALGAAASF